MKYTFECKACYKIVLCDSKEEVAELDKKHWDRSKFHKRHKPIFETMHVETRTSRKSRRPYVILTAD